MADTTPKPVEFRTLLLVDKERSSYGLRYSDFQRYRKHCANRVHRLRSSLKMTHGKGKEFKRLPPVESEKINSSYLQLLLFESERAWAYAQELLEVHAKSKEGSDRRKAMGRVRRSQVWAGRLMEQCKTLYDQGRLSASHYAEVVIYDLLVKGRFQRIRDEYDTGIASLAVARSMLDELAANASSSHDQAISTVFIDDVAPEIRHCAHSLGHKRAYDIDSIVKEVAPHHRQRLVPQYDQIIQSIRNDRNKNTDAKAAQRVLKNLGWEGEVVPLRNPELVDAFLKVELASKRLAEDHAASDESTTLPQKSRKKVTAFDSILQALSDAETIARKLSEARRLAGGLDASSGAGGSAPTRDIHFVHSFTTYQLLARRTQRDLLLIDALVSSSKSDAVDKPQKKSGSSSSAEDPRVNPAVVKIYDTVLQSLNQMRTLTVVDESADVAAATEARIAYIKAARCLFMARTYAFLKRYAEGVSLTQTAQVRIREARYQLSLLSTDLAVPETRYFPLSEAQISGLEHSIEQDENSMKIDWFAHNGGSAKTDTGATFKKPLFYDIAFNSIEDPLEKIQKRAGRMVETSKKAVTATAASAAVQHVATKAKVDEEPVTPEPEPEPARGGVLSGLLGGWWGRR